MLILTVSGSLRASSSNGAVLGAAAALAPSGVRVEPFESLAALPHFNPDVEERALPPEPAAWRALVGRADALLVSSPEYAHGVPGSLKNALDWLVGGPEMVGKPVAVINPSAHSRFAHAQLLETLRTMSAQVVDAACVTLPRRPAAGDGRAILDDPELAALVADAVAQLVAAARAAAAADERAV